MQGHRQRFGVGLNAGVQGATSHRLGFTLLEMLIVLAIIAIGLAVAMPKVRKILQEQRVDRAAQIVASDIRLAFTSAARGRVPVRVAIGNNVSSYAVVNRVSNDTIVRRSMSDGDIRISGAGGAVTLDVFPSGVAMGVDTIVVREGTYERRISMSRVGFIRVVPR